MVRPQFDGVLSVWWCALSLVVCPQFDGVLSVWWCALSLVVCSQFGGVPSVWWCVLSLVVCRHFGGVMSSFTSLCDLFLLVGRCWCSITQRLVAAGSPAAVDEGELSFIIEPFRRRPQPARTHQHSGTRGQGDDVLHKGLRRNHSRYGQISSHPWCYISFTSNVSCTISVSHRLRTLSHRLRTLSHRLRT